MVAKKNIADFPERIDERTIMFSRAELEKGTDRFERYYADHPGHLQADEVFRQLPGLLKEGATHYHSLVSPASEAVFGTVAHLHRGVEGPVNGKPSGVAAGTLTRFIRQWCLEMGAHSVGITELRPEHLYAVGGREHDYGQEIVNKHRYAIAFTVEMDYRRVRMAPKSPMTLESSTRYLHAGQVAVSLAAFMRNLGYPARAHIDGNYQVRCPQVARDAGLGEIGRMSLLMTPRLGPRVRIGVVTTDAPLLVTERVPDGTIADFCRICKKCAVNCPSGAISATDQPEDGANWRINQEACYTYWCRIGTDCGRCMAVCPYAHRNNAFHGLVRLLVRNSRLFRRMALPLDNWIYGRKPPVQDLDDWMEK